LSCPSSIRSSSRHWGWHSPRWVNRKGVAQLSGNPHKFQVLCSAVMAEICSRNMQLSTLWLLSWHGSQALQTLREREIYYKVPTILCGNTPVTIGGLEGASPVCLSFLASVQFSLFGLPQGEIRRSPEHCSASAIVLSPPRWVHKHSR